MNDVVKRYGRCAAILGSQWGDEGKGKLVDILSEAYDVIGRATGGANAGHTVYVGDWKFVFHLVPSGILRDGKMCVIGNGCVLHLPTIVEELAMLDEAGVDYSGRLLISDRAHLTFDYHKEIDDLQEQMKGDLKVGTTKRGIGPSYSDKINRSGIRACDLSDMERFSELLRGRCAFLKEYYGVEVNFGVEFERYRELAERFVPMLADTSAYLHATLRDGKSILIEGANGGMLDIDHGTYPYVTSSNATIGGVFSGTGLSPFDLTSAIGIVKAYTTRVGAGPFPTEDLGPDGEKLRETGGEFGSTTGRPRRCGWFDAPVLRYTNRLNGYTALNLTKLDVLNDFDTIKIATAYRLDGKELDTFPCSLADVERIDVAYEELNGWKTDISGARTFSDLPENARRYVDRISELVGVRVDFVGVGPKRDQMIVNADGSFS